MAGADSSKGSLQVVDFADGSQSVAVIPAIIDDQTKADSDSTDAADENESNDDGNEKSRLIQQSVPALNPQGLGTDIWQALRESLGRCIQPGGDRTRQRWST